MIISNFELFAYKLIACQWTIQSISIESNLQHQRTNSPVLNMNVIL